MHLVARVAPKITADLASRKEHLLLVHPGLIARYDQMAILETLRDKVGHDVPCPGLWVLVATDGQNDMPMLDHAEIPLITPGQRARVSEAWIDNVHRGHAEASCRRRSMAAAKERSTESWSTSRRSCPICKNLVTELAEDLARPCHEQTPRSTPGCGRPSSRSKRAAALPRRLRSGGRTISIRSPWRGCWPASSSASWRTTTSSTSAGWPGEGERRKLAEDTHELFFRKHPHDTDREYFQHVFHEVGKIPAAKDSVRRGEDAAVGGRPERRCGDEAAGVLAGDRRRDGAPQAVVRGRERRHPLPGRPVSGLSEKAKKKYALLQTPVFVEEFILDRTLNPAIDEFGLEKVRMIDPTCGSGHFLLGGVRPAVRPVDEAGEQRDQSPPRRRSMASGAWTSTRSPWRLPGSG